MKYFGTDGIRLNDKQKLEILTIKFAYALHKFNAKQVVLGHDGRPNSKRFKNKLKNALLTLGISTLDCGLVPSSFVSYYTVKHKANFGVVITASHNSADTNGIKTFNSNGEKLKVSQEKKIEKFFDELFDKDLTAQLKCIAKKHGIKKGKNLNVGKEQYIALMLKHLPALNKKTIVLDCANGASKRIAPEILKKTGGKIFVINTKCGKYINKNCGATAPQMLIDKVKQTNADMGFAFDGDADRCVVVLKGGDLLSGDNVLLGLARGYGFKKVVGTIYSTIAIEKVFNKNKIKFYRSNVGDQQVKKLINKTKSQFGGERPGHMIFAKIMPTGDGILTALKIAGCKKFDKLSHFKKLHSASLNLQTQDKTELMNKLEGLLPEFEKKLKNNGRILIRPSGTEQVVRVLIESQRQKKVEDIKNKILSQGFKTGGWNMCGIVAIISNKPVKDKLIESLEKLEYRGYDSAGIATKEKNIIKVSKTTGKVADLKAKLKNDFSHKGHIGIAHTRWATHGEASTINAHPFEFKGWTLVHNGIINNYETLKTKHNLTTQSQTDSEVVLQLLVKQNKNNFKAFIETCQQLEGSYALAVLNKEKQEIWFAKNQSPLFIAKTQTGIIAASDVVCFENITNFYRLEDGEFCMANENEIVFYNGNNQTITKQSLKLENLENNASKVGFSHFMEKEIFETKSVIENIYNKHTTEFDLPKNFKKILKGINRIKFIACGTAYHSALFGASVMQDITEIECSAHIASEFSTSLLNKKTLCIFVSQSGETADTLLALKKAKQHKCKTIGVVNVMHSTLATQVDFAFPVFAGSEIAVASTKAYSAQILALEILAHRFSSKQKQKEFWAEFENFKNTFEIEYDETTKKIISLLKQAKSCFVLGRGQDFITANEAALKIKETTYINSNALPSGELKHGSIALIDEQMPTIIFCTQEKHINKTQSAKQEILARGGKVLLLSQFKISDALPLQNAHYLFMPIVSIIPIQLAAFKVSTQKGINPDQPRNLAKSVTVE